MQLLGAQTLAVLASMSAVVAVATVVAVVGTHDAASSVTSGVAAASPSAAGEGEADPAPPDDPAAETLELELRTQDGRSTYRVGETVGIFLDLVDGDGSAVGGEINMGVGKPMPWPVADVACVQPAATYAAQPTRSRTTADAVYTTPGSYTIRAIVETANLCWPSTARETTAVTMSIDVVP